MAVKTKNKQDKLAVPSAVRSDKPKASDALKRLGRKKKKPKAAAKKDRPTLDLNEDAIEALKEWVPAKILSDYFEANTKQARAELEAQVWDLYLELMWDRKAQPENPAMEAGGGDVSGLFVVTERFSVQIPDDEDPEGSVAEALAELGVDEAKAQELVENELDFMPKVSIDITSLVHGKKEGKTFTAANATQKAAGSKLIDWLEEGGALELSEDEQEAVADAQETKYTADVSSGFLQRAPSYAGSKDELEGILSVIKPSVQLRSPKYAANDSKQRRNERLIEAADEIIKSTLGNL